jgi:hypothetical protein
MSKKTLKEMQAIAAQTAQFGKALESSAKISEELSSIMNKVDKKLGDMVKSEEKVKKGIKEAKNETEAWSNNMEDVANAFTSFGKILKGSQGGFRDLVKQASSFSEKFKGASGAMGKLSGFAGGFSKALGPAAMIAGQIWDTITSLDSYVKNLNKRFAEIRGPQIMGVDVKKQMKDFNSAIFSITDNLRDGLNAQEVYNFFDAINAAGQRITTLNQGFYGYRDAVHIAAKASKVFGMSLDATARYMASFGTDYQMQLEDIDDAFVQVAFDAQKSGLSTDRFWTAVTNASASLAFYGKFVKDASNTMKTFTDTQVTGADEAATKAQELTQMFSKASTQSNMAFAEIARKGGANLTQLFKSVAENADKEAAGIREKISLLSVDMDPANADAIDKLRKQLVAAEQKSTRATNASTAGIVAQGQDLAMLSGDAPKLMLDLISGINGLNFSTTKAGNRQLAAIQGAAKISGQSEQSIRELIYMAQTQAGLLKKGLVDDAGLIQGLSRLNNLTDTGNKNADILISGIKKLSSDTGTATLNEMSASMSSLLNMGKDQADILLKAASVDVQTRNFLAEQLSLAKSGMPVNQDEIVKKFNVLLGKTDVAKKLTQSNLTAQEEVLAQQKKDYDDTFKKLTDNTLSLSDMQKIIAEGSGYQLASLAQLQDISAATTSMARFLSGVGGYKSPSEKRAEKELKESGVMGRVKKVGATQAGVDILKEKQAAELVLAKKKKTEAVISQASGTGAGDLGVQFDKNGKITEDGFTTLMGLLDAEKKDMDEGQKAIIQAYQDSLMVSKKEEALTSKRFGELSVGAKKNSKADQAKTEEVITTADKQLTALNTIDEASVQTANLIAGQSDPEKIMQAMQSKYAGQTVNVDKILKDFGPTAVGMVKDKLDKLKLQSTGKLLRFKKAETVEDPSKNDVLDVMRGGMVNVKSGDVVVDKNSLAQVLGGSPGSAIPFLKGGAAAGGTVPGGNSIVITVNANEKDLGARIANEIKGALYQLNVVGR